MLNIPNHKRNANQDHIEILFLPNRMATVRRRENSKYWKRHREPGLFLHSWWEYKMVNHYGKHSGGSSKKLILKLPYNI